MNMGHVFVFIIALVAGDLDTLRTCSEQGKTSNLFADISCEVKK